MLFAGQHRMVHRVNCLRIGADEKLFAPGIPVVDYSFHDAVVLKEGLVGVEQKLHLRTEEVRDAPIVADTYMRQARVTQGQYGSRGVYQFGARKRFKGVILHIDAMRMRLPRGLQLVGKECIPGGIRLEAAPGKRYGIERSGKAFSFEKQQLFVLHPGEQLMVADAVYGAWGVTHTILVLKMCHKWLVAKYPSKEELGDFLDEQDKIVALWKESQPISAVEY